MATPLASIAARASATPQPSPPASTRRRSGCAAAMRANARHEVRYVLARFDRARERDEWARDAVAVERGEVGGGIADGRETGVIDAVVHHHDLARRSEPRLQAAGRVVAPGHDHVGAARRGRGSCAGSTRPSNARAIPGWSKNVRSCMATTVGHVGAQRHRVVRRVPDVGPDPPGDRRGPRPAPRRAGAVGGSARAGCNRRRKARDRPNVRCRRAGSADAARPRGAPQRLWRRQSCTRPRRPGGRGQPRRRAGRARGESTKTAGGHEPACTARLWPSARADPSSAPRPARARRARARRAAGRRRASSRSVVRTRRHRRARRARPRPARPPRAPNPSWRWSERREPSLRLRVARNLRTATRDRTRRPGGRARRAPTTIARRQRARTDGRGPFTSPQPRGPTTTSVRSGRVRRSCSTARTIVGRSLRGSTVPTVSTYGALDADPRDSAIDLVGVARRGRVDPERHDLDAVAFESFACRARRAVNSDGTTTRFAWRRASSRPRVWKVTPRFVVTSGSRRNAMSCTVTTSGWSSTGGTARLGACTTSASMPEPGSVQTVPELVPQAAARRTEIDPGDAGRDATRAGSRRERDRGRPRLRADTGAERSRSGRSRPGRVAAVGRRAPRRCTTATPRSGGSTTRGRERCGPTRRHAPDRGRGR